MATDVVTVETAIDGVEFEERIVWLHDPAAAQVFYRFAYFPKVRITLEVINESTSKREESNGNTANRPEARDPRQDRRGNIKMAG